MSTIPKILTYEDYLVLPEMMQRYEIIDGELIMSPSPTLEHQWHSTRIYRPLDDHVTKYRLGIVLFAPLDVMIRRSPLHTRQPDVLYISVKRLREYGLDSIKNVPFLEFPPDLVVEVISPSESQRQIEEKLADYQSTGVNECWLARPNLQTVEVVQLTIDTIESAGVFKNSEVIESKVLSQLVLSVAAIFASPDFLKW